MRYCCTWSILPLLLVLQWSDHGSHLSELQCRRTSHDASGLQSSVAETTHLIRSGFLIRLPKKPRLVLHSPTSQIECTDSSFAGSQIIFGLTSAGRRWSPYGGRRGIRSYECSHHMQLTKRVPYAMRPVGDIDIFLWRATTIACIRNESRWKGDPRWEE
jgi:hypothetical protein